MAWLSGWSYRKEITITGQSGAGTNYQVDLDIGDSAGGDFHLEGNCIDFPHDIAVTDNDGSTPLDFWIEDIAADPIKMWVEVADDLGSNQTIYVYYGKAEEPTSSNIGNTFLLGDDFPGSSIDTGKWDGNTADASVSGGIMSFGGAYSGAPMLSITQFGVNIACRSNMKFLNPSFYVDSFGFSNPANIHNSYLYLNYVPENKYTSKDGTTESYATTNIPINSWFISDIHVLGGISSSWFYDGVEGTNSPKTTNPPNANDLEVRFVGRASSVCVQSEWVVVRKYISTEPAFSSAGSEETPPVTGNPYWYYQMLKRRN